MKIVVVCLFTLLGIIFWTGTFPTTCDGASSSFRSSYTYRAYTYRAYTYRASTYRTYTYSSYIYRTYIYRTYNSLYRSYSYRSYQMRRLARYSRAYSFSSLGKFYFYHSLYPTKSRLAAYYINVYSTGYGCSNFEANSYGDFIGYMSCPMSFEPKNFTYCCGRQDSNYCCDDRSRVQTSSSVTRGIIAGAVIGSLILIGIIVAIIVGIIMCCKSATPVPRVQPVQTTTTVSTTTGYMNGTGFYPLETPIGNHYQPGTVQFIGVPQSYPPPNGSSYPPMPPPYSSGQEGELSSYPPPSAQPPPYSSSEVEATSASKTE